MNHDRVEDDTPEPDESSYSHVKEERRKTQDFGFRCPYADDHPKFEARLEAIERELSDMRRSRNRSMSELEHIMAAIGDLKADLANLKGRIVGYLLAGSIIAAAVAMTIGKLMEHKA